MSTKEIRFLLGEIEALLDRIDADWPNSLEPIGRMGEIQPAETEDDAAERKAYITHADGLQYSADADSDGFVTIPAIDVLRARLPRTIANKLPSRFAFERAYRRSTFPDDIAREKCERNMIARWRSPMTVPATFNWTARLVVATPIPIDGAVENFNSLPERRQKWTWSDDNLLDLPGNVAWSADCNPATGPATFLRLVEDRARAELEAVGLDPKDFGL